MDPMRYLRERAEARAFARQGKQLPKGQLGIEVPITPAPRESKIDDATAARMTKWDNMSGRDRYMYVNEYGSKLNEPFFPGQDPLKTKRAVTTAYEKAIKGMRG